MLVFLDLETTGLDPSIHSLLEVAAIIADDAFNEVARFHRVVHWHQASLMLEGGTNYTAQECATFNAVVPVVFAMHTANGLWQDSASNGEPRDRVDEALASFIAAACVATGEKSGPQLAGNTIDFDRAFLHKHMPSTFSRLHYRNVDVTTLNEMSRRLWPCVYDARPQPGKAHRAMADCVESLETARYYAKALMPAAGTFALSIGSGGAGAGNGGGGAGGAGNGGGGCR